MVHARKDYDRIQDPGLFNQSLIGNNSTPIGHDEPVVLFRAQDKHMVAVMGYYMTLIANDEDADFRIIESLTKHINLVTKWKQTHTTKSPDLPKE